MRAEIVEVLDSEKILRCLGNLSDAGQHSVGKDIAVDPGIAVDLGNIAADGMEEKDPFLFQTAVGDFHKRPVVLLSHVFEHSDGYDLVEAPLDLPVILTEDFHRQILTGLAGVPDLLLGNIDGRNLAAVMFGGIAGKTAPAAANVQNVILGVQVDFLANEIEFFLLGFYQIVCSLEVGAAVLIVGV